MPLNPSQIQSVLTTIGVGFALEYIDNATSGLKKTEDQVNKTKKSVSDLGSAADATSKRLESMAKAHQSLSNVSDRLLGISAGLASVNYAMRNVLGGAIAEAGHFQTELINVGLRLQDTSQKAYDTMKTMALGFTSQVNVPLMGAVGIMDSLSGSLKNLSQISAAMKPIGILMEGSGGQLDAGNAESLASNLVRRLNPNLDLQSLTKSQIEAQYNAAVGMAFKMHQDGKFRFDQIPTAMDAAQPYLMQLQNKHDKNATGDILGLTTMFSQYYPNNPAMAGQQAGQIVNLLDFSTLQRLRGKGIAINPTDGVGPAMQKILSNPAMRAYIRGDFANNPMQQHIYDEVFGGSMFTTQALRLLMRPGALSQFEHISHDITSDPTKTEEEYRKAQANRFEYQAPMLGNQLNALKIFGAESFLSPLTQILKVMNGIVGQVIKLAQVNPEIVKLAARFAGVATVVTGLGIGIKLLASGFELLNMWSGLTMTRLLLLSGALTGVGLVTSALGVAYIKNFDGMKTAVDRWFGGIKRPLEEFKILAEAAFQIFSNGGASSTHLDKKLWDEAGSFGLQGFIKSIATLQFNMRDLFKGISEGFQTAFKPFADSFLATFGKGGAAGQMDGALGGLHRLLNAFNQGDFLSVGQKLGQVFGGLAANIGNAFRVALPLIKEFFKLFTDFFNFSTQHPLIGQMIGQSIGGPVGTAMEGVSQAKLYGRQDTGLGKFITAAFASNDIVGKTQRGAAILDFASQGGIGNMLAAGILGLQLRGSMKGGLNDAPGAANGPEMGSIAINARNVYVNGNMSSGGGGSSSGGSSGGGGGWFHNLVQADRSLATIGTVGMGAGIIGWLLRKIPHGPTQAVGEAVSGVGRVASWIGNLAPSHFSANHLLKRPLAAAGRGIMGLGRNLWGGIGDLAGVEAAEGVGVGAAALAGAPVVPIILAVLAAAGVGYGVYKYATDPGVQKWVNTMTSGVLGALGNAVKPGSGTNGTVTGSVADHVQSAIQTYGSNAGKSLSTIYNGVGGMFHGALHLAKNSIEGLFLQTIGGHESGNNYGIPNQSGSGAMGRYQFMPTTAPGYVPSWFIKGHNTTRGPNAFLDYDKDGYLELNSAGRRAFYASPLAQDETGVNYMHFLQHYIATNHLGDPNDIKLLAEGWYGGPGSIGKDKTSGGVWGGHKYETVGSYGNEVAAAAAVAALANHTTVVHTHVHVDGKKVAEAVNSHNRKSDAHKAGRDIVTSTPKRPGSYK
jgi:hypothetical protein